MLSTATHYPENPLILRILILTITPVLFPICTGPGWILFVVEYAFVFETFCSEIDE